MRLIKGSLKEWKGDLSVRTGGKKVGKILPALALKVILSIDCLEKSPSPTES